MTIFRIAGVLLLLCGSFAQADWKTHVAPADSLYIPGRASIQYHPDGEFPTFSDALGQLREEGRLDRLEMITIHGQVVEPQFQQELVEALETHASREFAEARDSAGNMHNPKLEALNAVLDEIVLGLPTVQNLNVELGRVGRQISHASHEKLTLFDRDGELLIFFGLWLSVEAS